MKLNFPSHPPTPIFPMFFAGILAVFLAVPIAGAQTWTITTADLQSVPKAAVNTFSLKGGLSYTPENGALVEVAARQLIEIKSDRPAPSPASDDWQLVLRNNDVLEGRPVAMHDQFLTFKVSELGPIDVPFKNIAALETQHEKPAAGPPALDHDSIRLKNGDNVDGVISNISSDAVTIQSDLGNTDVDFSKITRVILGGAAAARAIPTLSARITFNTGTVLTTNNLDWTINDITLADPAGQARHCTKDDIASIEILGGRVVWLTELDPSHEEQTSTFDSKWPMQINRNVLGGPLVVNKTPFDRGIGVHAQSVLAYDLDGSFDTLALQFGLDDSAAPFGQANIIITLDGKTIYHAENVKPGMLSERLQLPITNGKHLELHADPANHLDVQARVDYLAPALIRK